MHMRGKIVPLTMAMSVPIRIITMSQLSANLNYTDKRERESKNQCLYLGDAPDKFLGVKMLNYEIRTGEKNIQL